jgi:hypothetical protein
MSTTEITTFTCDGCGKREDWPATAKTWTSVKLESVAWLGSLDRRRREPTTLHACSSACEKRIHLQRAGEKPDPGQLEAEARAERPDLARRLDELEILHSQQLKQQANEQLWQLQEVRAESEHLRRALLAAQAPTLRNLAALLRRALRRDP